MTEGENAQLPQKDESLPLAMRVLRGELTEAIEILRQAGRQPTDLASV